MKFTYPAIGKVFDLEDERVHALTIENPKLFYELLSDLQKQIDGNDGKSVISKENKILQIPKSIELISQFISFDINQKSLINKALSKMEQIAIEDYYAETMGQIGKLEGFLYKLASHCSGNIEFNKLEISGILHNAGFAFSNNHDSLCEKIADYMELVTDYIGEKAFFFVNLRSYVSEQDYGLLLDTITRHRYQALMIENHAYPLHKLEKRYIVDIDLCEIDG